MRGTLDDHFACPLDVLFDEVDDLQDIRLLEIPAPPSPVKTGGKIQMGRGYQLPNSCRNVAQKLGGGIVPDFMVCYLMKL
jgi:hypothetical protein